MFILNQIAKHNSKWRIWVCLLGYSKAGITWAVYYLSQTESTSKTVEHVWLVRPDTYLAFSVCMHTLLLCNDCQVWVSLIQFTFSPSPFMPVLCPPIKNAPRWLVKGRWEWRLGLFRDPSQLFKAKFDSENGGGLITHAEVFEDLVANVMQDVLIKLAKASTIKKCWLYIRFDKFWLPG